MGGSCLVTMVIWMVFFDAVLIYFFSVTPWLPMAAFRITPSIRASALASGFFKSYTN
jgi:hypothetical protein